MKSPGPDKFALPPPLTLSAAAATSAGRVRPTNEDRHLVAPDHGCFAIADGIGGLPYGERASECAIRCLARELGRLDSQTACPLDQVVATCHQAVRQLGAVLSPHTDIGTTFTALRIHQTVATVAHVGDSAAFLHPGRTQPIHRLTTDHTVPAPTISIPGITTNTFAAPTRLDRYLGQATRPECDLVSVPVASGDRLILCSDGVTRALAADELATLSQAQSSPAALARALVHIADLRGGLDNATAVVIDLF